MLNRALKNGEDEATNSRVDRSCKPEPPANTPAGGQSVPRSPHPGYGKIAAWMKRKYKDRIPRSGEPFQQALQLEQLTAEACSGLPAKTKKGFLDYLKKQNYEPLLK